MTLTAEAWLMKECIVYDGFRFPDVGRMSDVDLCQVLAVITDYAIINTLWIL